MLGLFSLVVSSVSMLEGGRAVDLFTDYFSIQGVESNIFGEIDAASNNITFAITFSERNKFKTATMIRFTIVTMVTPRRLLPSKLNAA